MVSTVFHHIGEHVHERETHRTAEAFCGSASEPKCGTKRNADLMRGRDETSEDHSKSVRFFLWASRISAPNVTPVQPNVSKAGHGKTRKGQKIGKVRRVHILVTRKCKKKKKKSHPYRFSVFKYICTIYHIMTCNVNYILLCCLPGYVLNTPALEHRGQ